MDLLKINVEGAERDVLAGAAATLAANPDIVLVVEFLRENAERWGHTIEALETDLRAYGFRLFALSGLGLAPYTPVGRLAVNVVAARHVTRVLPGLPEALAAQLLMRLCDATGARGPRLATPQASGEVRYVISRTHRRDRRSAGEPSSRVAVCRLHRPDAGGGLALLTVRPGSTLESLPGAVRAAR